jgi:hypothetical protein
LRRLRAPVEKYIDEEKKTDRDFGTNGGGKRNGGKQNKKNKEERWG